MTTSLARQRMATPQDPTDAEVQAIVDRYGKMTWKEFTQLASTEDVITVARWMSALGTRAQ